MTPAKIKTMNHQIILADIFKLAMIVAFLIVCIESWGIEGRKEEDTEA